MLGDILYVEDNPDHAELVLRHLELRQLREHVVHVDDGERAVEHLTQVMTGAQRRPQVVLLDLRLPRVDGLEVLRHIKESPGLRGIPVVVLTTSASDRDVNEAAARHANSYLVKPHERAALAQTLDALSHYWLDLNRTGGVEAH